MSVNNTAYLGTHSAAYTRTGLLSGLGAYLLWGLFPVYFILAKTVPAMELLGHRVLWSVPFCFIIIALRKQIPDVIEVIKQPKTMGLLALSAIVVAANWGVYIWAVQNEQIFQGSLGYYINPLVYILVGMVFFKEKLTPLKKIAILLAAIGVATLTIYGGQFPTIALFLGVSFAAYGVLKRITAVRAMTGLFIETSILFVPALIVMIFWANQGTMQFTQQGLAIDALILLAGPITVIPLFAFAIAARRIKLTTLGIMQYIAPTLQFFCAVYFGEPFTRAHMFCFAFIWIGVGVFCWDSLQNARKYASP